MKNKLFKATIFFSIALCFLMNTPKLFALGSFKQEASHNNEGMSEQEYAKRVESQNEYHSLRLAGNRERDKGDYKAAIVYQEKALKIAVGSSLEGVSRGELSRLYEEVGSYEKALEQVEWILRQNPSSPKYIEAKARIFKKIEEQKKWESKQDPIVAQAKEVFDEANSEEQKQFLESLGGQGVLDVFKNAMVAEHSGDYGKAREIYASLLPRKEEIDTQMGVGGWAMLYPAIQRTSELLGDEKREKEALVWIKDNLLNPNGEQHASLSKLQPQVIAHIQKRIEEYQL